MAFGAGTFLNTATGQCEIECSSLAGRRLDALQLEAEEDDPSDGKEIVSGFLAQHPELAGGSHASAMENLVNWLHEQHFGQPALA